MLDASRAPFPIPPASTDRGGTRKRERERERPGGAGTSSRSAAGCLFSFLFLADQRNGQPGGLGPDEVPTPLDHQRGKRTAIPIVSVTPQPGSASGQTGPHTSSKPGGQPASSPARQRSHSASSLPRSPRRVSWAKAVELVVELSGARLARDAPVSLIDTCTPLAVGTTRIYMSRSISKPSHRVRPLNGPRRFPRRGPSQICSRALETVWQPPAWLLPRSHMLSGESDHCA